MVASTGTPLSRTSVELKIAFWERKAFSSVRNWGRISSALAMKVPASLETRSSRAWRSKLVQMRVPAILAADALVRWCPLIIMLT